MDDRVVDEGQSETTPVGAKSDSGERQGEAGGPTRQTSPAVCSSVGVRGAGVVGCRPGVTH